MTTDLAQTQPRDIVDALARNNANVGAGYIERNGAQFLIRSPGQVSSIASIGSMSASACHCR